MLLEELLSGEEDEEFSGCLEEETSFTAAAPPGLVIQTLQMRGLQGRSLTLLPITEPVFRLNPDASTACGRPPL